jgi:hypothetical protein
MKRMLRSEAGLTNLTELYNNIFCPLGSNQNIRFTDSTFNDYLVINT